MSGRFDTKVQYLRYQVLREVARHAFAGYAFGKLYKYTQDDSTWPQTYHEVLRI